MSKKNPQQTRLFGGAFSAALVPQALDKGIGSKQGGAQGSTTNAGNNGAANRLPKKPKQSTEELVWDPVAKALVAKRAVDIANEELLKDIADLEKESSSEESSEEADEEKNNAAKTTTAGLQEANGQQTGATLGNAVVQQQQAGAVVGVAVPMGTTVGQAVVPVAAVGQAVPVAVGQAVPTATPAANGTATSSSTTTAEGQQQHQASKKSKREKKEQEGDKNNSEQDSSDSDDEASDESLPVSTPNLIGEALQEGEESMVYKCSVDKWIRDDKMANLFFYYHVADKKLYCWNSDDWAMYRWRSNFSDMEFLHHAQIDTTNRGNVVWNPNLAKQNATGPKQATGGPDLWITVIPPEVTTTISRQTRVYEIPEKLFNRVFHSDDVIEQMRKQSNCGSATFGEKSGKYGRQVEVAGTPRQITEFGNALEQGLVAAGGKGFDTKKWRKQQQETHMERLKASGGTELDEPIRPTLSSKDEEEFIPDEYDDTAIEKMQNMDELQQNNNEDIDENIAELAHQVALFTKKHKLPLESTRRLLKMDAQLQRYVVEKFKLPAANSKADKVFPKFVSRLSAYPQKWRLEACISNGDMDDVCETRVLRQGIDNELEVGAASGILRRQEEKQAERRRRKEMDKADTNKDGTDENNKPTGAEHQSPAPDSPSPAEDDDDEANQEPRMLAIPDANSSDSGNTGNRQLYGDVQDFHCRIHDMFGYWHVTSCEDRIGILVDGEKVRASYDGPMPLRDGSVIVVGKTLLLCEIGDSTWLTERRNKYYDKLMNLDGDRDNAPEDIKEEPSNQAAPTGSASINADEDAERDVEPSAKRQKVDQQAGAAETLLPPE
ncbi:unnamed protein product [Amoebophrya sp. A120]|nr:unnamed protein product [Amoebophrya sp. A120]|eukprot:GSA120T00016457001.1